LFTYAELGRELQQQLICQQEDTIVNNDSSHFSQRGMNFYNSNKKIVLRSEISRCSSSAADVLIINVPDNLPICGLEMVLST
jgi:hypothetical protein